MITFVKRIFQCAVPVSMTLIYNSQKKEDQLLVADTEMKFKLFDKNTFEILATFLGPIYDSYVQQFVSISGNTDTMDVGLKDPLSFCFPAIIHLYSVPLSSHRMQAHRFHPQLLTRSFSSSQQTKAFVSTRCPSMGIRSGVWVLWDIAVESKICE